MSGANRGGPGYKAWIILATAAETKGSSSITRRLLQASYSHYGPAGLGARRGVVPQYQPGLDPPSPAGRCPRALNLTKPVQTEDHRRQPPSMPKRKKGSKKSSGVEYCRGYVDEHGQWNNGFYCPQWGGPGRKYCCGTDTHRVCCPKEQPVVHHAPTLLDHLPLILGLAIGALVVIVAFISTVCYFCRGCWVYRRRKRLQHGGGPCSSQPPPGGRTPDYAVSYSVCPHPPYMPDGLGHTCYPLDDPPPYPGEGLHHSVDEKQPLNPSHLYVAMETPDEVLLTAGRRDHDQPSVVSGSVLSANSELPHVEVDDATSSMSHSGSAATALVSTSSSSENMAQGLRSAPPALEAAGQGTSQERRRSHPQRTHQLLLKALSRSASDSDRQRPATYSRVDTARPNHPQQSGRATKSPKSSKASSSSSSSSSFSPSKSIELGAFLRTLSERRGQDVGGADDGEPQQTTKLLSDDGLDNPLGPETGDDVSDDVSDQEEVDEEDDGEEEGTSGVTSQTVGDSLSLDDCTVQVIPQG